MFAVLGWMVFGLVIGLIARAIYPGPQAMGVFATMALGIVGSLLGGGISWLIWREPYHAAGYVMSTLGAMFLIWVAERGAQPRMT